LKVSTSALTLEFKGESELMDDSKDMEAYLFDRLMEYLRNFIKASKRDPIDYSRDSIIKMMGKVRLPNLN
jgi:hypothetical protein